MAQGVGWSDPENEVIVAAYLKMLECELRGESFNKAETNRVVRERIDRTVGSVEYKFQNVSAVLREMRYPFVAGYKPATNVQESLRTAVAKLVEEDKRLVELVFARLTESVPNGASFDMQWRDVAAPNVELPSWAPTQHTGKWDFIRIDAENRALGLAGERAVVRREMQYLRLAGLDNLAERVEHVSVTRGDGLGFDVLSFTPAGQDKFIEVKTTRLGLHWPMLVSRNEIAFSQSQPDSFHLYRLFDFSTSCVGLYTLPGDITASCDLSPATYQALPATSSTPPSATQCSGWT
jgi:hypothetical protein